MRTLNRALGTAASIAVMLAGAALAAPTWAAEAAGGAAQEGGAEQAAAEHARDCKHWQAENEVSNLASLQRGARNFLGYCLGCHSLKYVRYSRLGGRPDDSAGPAAEDSCCRPGDKPAHYILTSMPASDAEAWFGKAPPDLSLMARARGADYLYQFLKTFYARPATARPAPTTCACQGTAMPHVLSELEGREEGGLQGASRPGREDGKASHEQVFDKFETGRARAPDARPSTTSSCAIP